MSDLEERLGKAIVDMTQEIEKLRAENADMLSAAQQANAEVARLCEENEQLEQKLAEAKAVLEQINDPRRLRNTSFLASNPPQNAGVWEIQVLVRAFLESASREVVQSPDAQEPPGVVRSPR